MLNQRTRHLPLALFFAAVALSAGAMADESRTELSSPDSASEQASLEQETFEHESLEQESAQTPEQATAYAAEDEAENADDSADPAKPSAQLTPFTAHYKTAWKLGWFSIDIEASRTLRQLTNGNWQLIFEADASAAGLVETSEFSFEDGLITPLEYRYRGSGLINESDRTLVFTPEFKRVSDLENQQQYSNAWKDTIQDNLTYMLQAGLDLAKGDEDLQYQVFEKNRAKDFEFEVVGEEQLNTDIGRLNTIKLRQVRKNKNRNVYAWYAIDHNYQLVRLQDKKDGETRYQIDITALK